MKRVLREAGPLLPLQRALRARLANIQRQDLLHQRARVKRVNRANSLLLARPSVQIVTQALFLTLPPPPATRVVPAPNLLRGIQPALRVLPENAHHKHQALQTALIVR